MDEPFPDAQSSAPGREDDAADGGAPLFEDAYSELRKIAAVVFQRGGPGDSLHPTALVHELYLRLGDRDPQRCESRTHFMALAAKAMRQIVIDHARRRQAAKRGGGWQRVTLADAVHADAAHVVDLVALNDALTQLAALHARQAQIVELRYLGGLTIREIAGLLDLSPQTVKRDWRMARAWLLERLAEGDVP